MVTGGCGFIGSNFIEYLFNNFKNLRIINIDKLGIGSREIYSESYSPGGKSVEYNYLPNGDVEYTGNYYCLLDWDLCDLKKEFIFMLDFDYIFHFAAESHVDRSIDSPISFIENNILGITRLLDWVKMGNPTARVINISTDEVYGHLHPGEPPFTELSPIAPRSPYSASKASADLVAKSYVETFGLDIVTTRCCNNYGPNQFDEKFIPTIVRHLMQGKKVPVYGKGENIREWIYVDDHNKSILEIAEFGKKGEVYNIGSGVEMNNIEMIMEILKILKPDGFLIQDHIEFVEDRKGHDFRYAISSLNYRREFELEDFREALEKTVNFYAEKYEI